MNITSARRDSILVVDDDDDTRVICSVCLARAGYAVDIVGSGAEAIEAARTHRYAVILTDLSLPDMEGWELIRRLRASTAAEAAFILMTGYDGVREMARQLGCVACLVKPVMLDDLCGTVQSAADGGASGLPA